MGFRKYQKTERTNVLSPENHRKVESHLSKLGKHSMTDLTEEERERLLRELANQSQV